MKNKKIGLIIGVLVVIILLVGCWFFLKKGDKTGQEYVIKKWHNYSQNVEIVVDDDTIINVEITSEVDDSGALTGGENAVFTLTGLKKGSTMVTVNVVNDDGSAESSESYYFEVDDKLNVKLVDNKTNSSVIDVE